jgi:bacillithiol biosynthesis deacetylase BshB1
MTESGLDLLVLCAHPDDAEVNVGGLLALCSKRGMKAGILDLTNGDLGTRGTPEIRHAEAMEAARILGVQRHNLGLPDARFPEDESSRVMIMESLRALRPRILVLPHPAEHHPDHRRAHRLGLEAAFCSGLKNYPCEGSSWRPEALAWVGGRNPPTPPDLLIDVSEVWDRRMAAFDAFVSQFSPDASPEHTHVSHPTFRSGIVGRAIYWGSRLQTDYAEGLWCEKPIHPALLRLTQALNGPSIRKNEVNPSE